MSACYTPVEYIAALDRQIVQVSKLAAGLSETSLNWQPDGGSWSIGQCLEHLVRTNKAVLGAMRQTVESNRDELRPRSGKVQAAGWLSRWFVRAMGPDANSKFRAPKKVVPASQVSGDVAARFAETQRAIEQFMTEFASADLGALRYPNPLIPIVRWTIDTGLLIIVHHNARHLQQAERVKQSAGFPGVDIRARRTPIPRKPC